MERAKDPPWPPLRKGGNKEWPPCKGGERLEAETSVSTPGVEGVEMRLDTKITTHLTATTYDKQPLLIATMQTRAVIGSMVIDF